MDGTLDPDEEGSDSLVGLKDRLLIDPLDRKTRLFKRVLPE